MIGLHPDERPEGPRFLAHHRAGECLWPVGPEPANEDMSRMLFCCQPVEDSGQRYCRACRDGHKPNYRKGK